MIRKLGFGLVLLTAFIVSGCSGELSPAPKPTGDGGALNPDVMTIKFRVAGQMNFSKYNYVVVFNTTGNGVTPLPLGQQNSFAGYSFAIIVTGASGVLQATAWQCFRPPGISDTVQPTFLQLVTTPQQLEFTPKSNGQANEFTVTFYDVIGESLAPASNRWLLNMFTTSNVAPAPGMNLIPLDSLGAGGAIDTTYISPVYDITTPFDAPIVVKNHTKQIADPNAQIATGEIINIP